jgi:hypothetical protein
MLTMIFSIKFQIEGDGGRDKRGHTRHLHRGWRRQGDEWNHKLS